MLWPAPCTALRFSSPLRLAPQVVAELGFHHVTQGPHRRSRPASRCTIATTWAASGSAQPRIRLSARAGVAREPGSCDYVAPIDGQTRPASLAIDGPF